MTRPAGGQQWPRNDYAAGGGGGGVSGDSLVYIAGYTPPPALTDFTARNITTMVSSQEPDGVFLRTPSANSKPQGYTKTKATALIKVSIGFFMDHSQTNAGTGILLRDSATGTYVMYVYHASSWKGWRYDNAGTWQSEFMSVGVGGWDARQPCLLQVEDDGTNRLVRISNSEGRKWRTIHSIGRTDNGTMTDVGFGMHSESQNYEHTMYLVHFKEG
jgi:hypothetical protein